MAVVRSLTVNAALKTADFESGARKVQNSLKTIRSETQTTAKTFEDMGRSMITMLAGVASLSAISSGIRSIVTETAKLQSATSAFSALTGSAEGAKRELAFVATTANKTGQAVGELTKAYLQLTASTKGTRLEGQATRELFAAVTQAGRTLGMTTDETGRALRALGQMAAVGVVSLDELKQEFANALPGGLQIASRAMGMTTQNMLEMISKGDVLADNLIPRITRQLKAELGDGADGASASFARLENSLVAVAQAMGRDIVPELARTAEGFARLIGLSEETAGTLGQALAPVFRTAGAAALSLATGVILAGKGIAALGVFASEGLGGLRVALEDMKDFAGKMDQIINSLLAPAAPVAPKAKAPVTIESLTGGVTSGTEAVAKSAEAAGKKFGDWLPPIERAKQRLQEIDGILTRPGKAGAGGGPTRAPASIAAIINREAPKYGQDPRFVEAIMKVESNFDPTAVSTKGAVGLMQLMPANIKAFNVANPMDPEQNIVGALKLLAQLSKQFGGDLEKIATAYHSGPGKAISGDLGPDGRAYAPAVIGTLKSYISDTRPADAANEAALRKEMQALREYIAVEEAMTKAGEATVQTIERQGESLTQLIARLKDKTTVLSTEEEAQVRSTLALVSNWDAAKAMITSLLDDQKHRRARIQTLKDDKEAVEDLADAERLLWEGAGSRRAVEEQIARMEQYRDFAFKTAQDTRQFSSEKIANRQAEIGRYTMDMVDGMVNALKKGGNAWVEFAETVARSFLRIAMEKSNFESKVGEWLEKGLGLVLKFAGAASGTGGVTLDTAAGDIGMGGADMRAFGKAAGGPVSANRPYLIGERGPEIVTFGQSGTIISNSAMHASTTGGTHLASTYMAGGTSHSQSTSSVVQQTQAPQITVIVNATDAQSFVKSRSEIARAMGQAMQGVQRSM